MLWVVFKTSIMSPLVVQYEDIYNFTLNTLHNLNVYPGSYFMALVWTFTARPIFLIGGTRNTGCAI